MAHRAKVEPGGCIQTDPYNPEWQLFVVEAILSPPASIAGVRLYRSPSSLAGRPCHLMGADTDTPPHTCPTTGWRPSSRGLSLFGSSSSVCSLGSLSLCLSVTLSSFLCATKNSRRERSRKQATRVLIHPAFISLDGSYSGNHKRQIFVSVVLLLPLSDLCLAHLSLTSILQRADSEMNCVITERPDVFSSVR